MPLNDVGHDFIDEHRSLFSASEGEPKGVSSWTVPMAFPTSHSHPDGTGNPAPTWWRGPVRVRAQTEGGAKPAGERDRIPLGLVAVSTTQLRSIVVETGNTRYANLRF